jgi:hypothetical protein
MPLYVAEFGFRYNNRFNEDIFGTLSVDAKPDECPKRNSYKEFVQKAYAYYRNHGLIGIIRNGWTWLLADSDRLTALSTFAIFLATAVAVGVGIAQWRVLSGQLSEMKSSSEQVERSITASNRIADETKTANALTHESNRPWIGAVTVTVDPPIVAMKPAKINLTFSNAGKSPAQIIKIKCGANILDAFPTEPAYLFTAIQEAMGSKSIMVPGQQFSCPLNRPPLSSQEVGRIRLSAGSYGFYVYGEIVYRDTATEIEHVTHVCWLYNAGVDGYVFCSTYNSAK